MSKMFTDDEIRAMITYVVIKDFGKKSNAYKITKLQMGVELDNYHCSVRYIDELEGAAVWCDCPGFRRQKFDKMQHKHIMLVLDYQKRGEPTSATYTIIGTGRNAKIKFLRQMEESNVK